MLRNLTDIQWCTHATPLSGTRLRTTGATHMEHQCSRGGNSLSLCDIPGTASLVNVTLNMRYKSDKNYQISYQQNFFKLKMHQNPFSAGTPPRIPLEELTTLPRSSCRLERWLPSHPPFNAFGVSKVARLCSGRALDLWSRGCRFDSRPAHCRVATLGKLFTPMCLCRCKWSSGRVSDS